jgi:tetratricopeptide (TPR) repeat protein
MVRRHPTLLALGLAALAGCSRAPAPETASAAGAAECRACHPGFYKKWAASRHGRAMQPYSAAFARDALTPQAGPLEIGGAAYRAVPAEGFIEERGAGGTRRFALAHVLGGKNAYYFLTPLDRGRLQVLPLAYDVHTRRWYDMAASGVRAHAGAPPERPLPWTDPAFTFNTSCFSCHVSQLRTNYDLAADTYRSTWREPGIDCETCHGDGAAHAALMRKGAERNANRRILGAAGMSTAQRNDMCAPCHAKMNPLGAGYRAGERFFDRYDLVALEHSDFHPDGRDLGETYTYTGWRMSPCARSGKLDCLHCHASTGQFKFAGMPDGACAPCHAAQAANPRAHSHHEPGKPGGYCIDCHMPRTRFARMSRSDHSLLPPAPAATVRHQSPNACNLCHRGRSAAWADAQVRRWYTKDYQRPVLERAALIAAARKGDWARLPAMLAYIGDRAGDAVTRASLIRLLRTEDDPRRTPVLLAALGDPDPLVRSAAAAGLAGAVTPEVRAALARAAADEFRLVRIRAAASLAGVLTASLPEDTQRRVRAATAELLASFEARPDDFASHTNRGNFHLGRNELDAAIRSYETALRLRPDSVGTLVNAAMAYTRAGRAADAGRALDQALRLAPGSAPANFNRGLLLAEAGDKAGAEAALRQALRADPQLAPAAFNLCILLAEKGDGAALGYCRQAAQAEPRNAKYVYTLAFYEAQAGQAAAAARRLETLRQSTGAFFDADMLLADLYLRSGRAGEARALYAAAAARQDLSLEQRAFVTSRLRGHPRP